MVVIDLTDCKLLEAIRDAWMLVQFFNTTEGERLNKDTNLGSEARRHMSELVMEAAKRELNYMECLQ